MSSIPRFFVEKEYINQSTALIAGTDASHICKVLRLKPGDAVTVCDCQNGEYDGVIVSANLDGVAVSLSEKRLCPGEPPYALTLFQGMPKGDKPDTIVQKAVELGATKIVFVMCDRAVSRPDAKSMEKKLIRLNRIAFEAAKQCGRGVLPKVESLSSYSEMLTELKKSDVHFICYEEALSNHIRGELKKCTPQTTDISFFIGPEGGISPEEANKAKAENIPMVGLGNRILRTETASGFVLSAISVLTEDV